MNIIVIQRQRQKPRRYKALKKSGVETILRPASATGGMATDALRVPMGAKERCGMVRFAQKKPGGFCSGDPEDDPLVLGAARTRWGGPPACLLRTRGKAAVIETQGVLKIL